jgi:hypothetical protein
MALALAIILFLTIALVVFSFGAAAYSPFSVLGSRLRALGWQKTEVKEKPDFKDRLEQALDPLSKALPLSPTGHNHHYHAARKHHDHRRWRYRWCPAKPNALRSLPSAALQQHLQNLPRWRVRRTLDLPR